MPPPCGLRPPKVRWIDEKGPLTAGKLLVLGEGELNPGFLGYSPHTYGRCLVGSEGRRGHNGRIHDARLDY